MPFVDFEGIDKSGKGTQIKRFATFLKSLGKLVMQFGEPNDHDNKLGKRIRAILQKVIPPQRDFVSQRLYVLDRAQDHFCIVLPTVQQGDWVLAERYALSTLAFGARDGNFEPLIELHHQIIGPSLVWPDVTYLLDISPDEALHRLAASEGAPQFFEKRRTFEYVRSNYLKLVERRDLGPIVVIPAHGTEDEVFGTILADLKERFHLKV